MARHFRYVPEGGALVEVTCRTLHGRLLLRPSLELNGIIGGVLGRALRLYPLRFIVHAWASNHYHLLVWVEDARTLSRFMCYLNSNLAREVSRLTGWSGKIWERRYQAILVSEEERAQAEKIKKSPAPFVHAATKATRQFFYGLYAEFVAAYRTAAEKLRAGDPKPGFPIGCFPPPLPFVTG